MSLPRVLGFAMIWAAVAVSSCTGPTASECDEETPCAFGSQCVLGECVEGRCANSSQCPIEHTCTERECVPGCELDSDCLPGNRCNTEDQTCEPQGCTSTEVDCHFGQFCNQATGECYDAADTYCKRCDVDAQCGDGNLCYGGYCAVSCSGGRECPAGYSCEDFTDQFGNPVARVCFTLCEQYADYEPGDWDSRSKDPGASLTDEERVIARDRAEAAGVCPW